MVEESGPRRKTRTEPADQTPVSWEEMAVWWDEAQGEEGDLWHRTLIDPTLLMVLGQVDGLKVLDLACGNGYLSRRPARSGAKVIGVDAAASIVELARSREEREPLGITYHVADAARLDMLEDGTFDVVLSNMALMDLPDAEVALKESARVLRSGGRLVASLSHPCFDLGDHSGWMAEQILKETTVWRRSSWPKIPKARGSSRYQSTAS